MTEIIKGSLVSVVFSIIAFSHTDVNNMYSYDGVPCLLDIIAGSGMIVKALDDAIMCMSVDDEREICIPAIDAHQTARALGVRMRGILKYQLKVIRVVNTPAGESEIAQFFSRGTATLGSLSECREVKKGPFNISRTYDMFEAVAISEEYRILESICKQNTTDDVSEPRISSNIGEQNSLHEIGSNNRSVQISCIPIHSHSKSQFLLPSWPVNVLKENFLPDLMRLAITSGSRIIILFDSPDDWEEISKCVAEEKRIKDNNQSNSSNGKNIGNVDRIKLDENSPIEMTDIEVQELGSEITMAVESEETDATKESVLTWLRIAIDSKSVNSSCRKYSIDGEYERDVRDVKRSRSTAEESQEGSFAEKPSPLTVNIITDNITDNTSGYRVALIRFSGWVRGSAPQGRLWDGFWKLYTRAKSEVTASLGDTPLSVLVADIGAIPTTKPDNIHCTDSEVSITPAQPEGAEDTSPEPEPWTADSGAESVEKSFGGGDRAGLFLLVERVLESVREGQSSLSAATAAATVTVTAVATAAATVAAAATAASSIHADITAHVCESSTATSTCNAQINSTHDDDALPPPPTPTPTRTATHAPTPAFTPAPSLTLTPTASHRDDLNTSSRAHTASLSSQQIGAYEHTYAVSNISGDGDKDLEIPTHNYRPKISLDDVTPKDYEKSAQIIAFAKESMAVSDQDLLNKQVEAKERLASRLNAKNLPPTPSECIGETSDSRLLLGVGCGQGEDGTCGVIELLQPVTASGAEGGVTDDAHDKAETDRRTPSLCISQILFELNSADMKKDFSKRLFVTHAQYKFAYKIACDFCRKK